MFELWEWNGHYIKGKLKKTYKSRKRAETGASKFDDFNRFHDDGTDILIMDSENRPIGLIHEVQDSNPET
jgi:hypothetical protein